MDSRSSILLVSLSMGCAIAGTPPEKTQGAKPDFRAADAGNEVNSDPLGTDQAHQVARAVEEKRALQAIQTHEAAENVIAQYLEDLIDRGDLYAKIDLSDITCVPSSACWQLAHPCPLPWRCFVAAFSPHAEDSALVQNALVNIITVLQNGEINDPIFSSCSAIKHNCHIDLSAADVLTSSSGCSVLPAADPALTKLVMYYPEMRVAWMFRSGTDQQMIVDASTANLLSCKP